MAGEQAAGAGYVIPRYRAEGHASWWHVLHGNVPGHQIDFMYCPEVPQGQLTLTHFSHLARLMKYIEPQTNATHAFAIGNLSRDDTQHEPGHGAVGLIFGFRIGGAVDHAGRANPPFAHGLIAVDRDLGFGTLLEASATFYRHVMNATEANSSAAMFYGEYVSAVLEGTGRAERVLERYVDEFGDLPYLQGRGLGCAWVADEEAVPKRVVIVHGEDETFGAIAHAAARIAAVLCRSNVRWTAISSGREADIPGGVSVRFVGERDLSEGDRRGAVLLRIEEIGEDEGEVARRLFGARAVAEAEPEKPRYAGWRERFAAQQAGGGGGAGEVAAAAPSSSQRGRLPTPMPPSHRGLDWEDGREAGAAGGQMLNGRGSRPPAPAPGSTRGTGPQGTLVIDREQLLRGGRGSAAPTQAASEAAAIAAERAWQEGSTMRSGPLVAGGGAAIAATAMGMASGMGAAASASVTRGATDEPIPIVVERPPTSRKWIWAAAGVMGCAALVVVLLLAVASSSGEAPPDLNAPTARPPDTSAAPAPGGSAAGASEKGPATAQTGVAGGGSGPAAASTVAPATAKPRATETRDRRKPSGTDRKGGAPPAVSATPRDRGGVFGGRLEGG